MVNILKYIRGTKYLNLIISSENSVMPKWYIDVSYDVNPNIRGYTGGGITTGQGFPISESSKQKLKDRISTK